jgi:hypothetical protein
MESVTVLSASLKLGVSPFSSVNIGVIKQTSLFWYLRALMRGTLGRTSYKAVGRARRLSASDIHLSISLRHSIRCMKNSLSLCWYALYIANLRVLFLPLQNSWNSFNVDFLEQRARNRKISETYPTLRYDGSSDRDDTDRGSERRWSQQTWKRVPS